MVASLSSAKFASVAGPLADIALGPRSPLEGMDNATRTKVLLGLMLVLILGAGLILLVILGARMVRRATRESEHVKARWTAGQKEEDDWARKRIVPHAPDPQPGTDKH